MAASTTGSGSRRRTIRAGTPTTVQWDGMSRTTTALAPIAGVTAHPHGTDDLRPPLR